MNQEEEIFKLAQKVAVLESRNEQLEQQLNGLGDSLRNMVKERLDEPVYGIEPRLCVAERNIFKAQIYTAATTATVTALAVLIQYTLTTFGISVSDLFIKARK